MILKGYEDRGQLSPEEIVEIGRRDRAAVTSYFTRFNALRREIEQFENRYDIKSEDLATAIRSGKISETPETARWSVVYETICVEEEWQRRR